MKRSKAAPVVNVLMVKVDAMYVSFQADSWDEAVLRVSDLLDDPSQAGVAKVYMSDGSGLEEHRLSDLRAHAARLRDQAGR